ncbi:MAG: GNAT family N-acetyltransferase [Flavobacteriales bacterium]|nr:GNAT family N-acetyltransferase [Flavobacteriales bacterium]
MLFRKSTYDDINGIMKIIHDAQQLLASQGSDQWQDGYPDVARINLDIDNNESYVLESEDGELMATTMFTFEGEPTYNLIEGEWLTQEPVKYGVIHRLAVSADHRQKGLAKIIVIECEKMLVERKFDSLRLDTHRLNKGMQHMLDKLEYKYCGIIYLTSGSERLAYEKIISQH